MTTKFVPGGPERRSYQKIGLNEVLRNRGVHALLFDPGMGKTAVVIDYASILAMKLPEQEVRVLVVCPLVAVDTWILQLEKFAAPGVNYWAESIGGSLLDRARALAARGGNLYQRGRLAVPLTFGQHPRALNVEHAWTWRSRPEIKPDAGPDAIPKPRIVLEVINLDTLVYRTAVGRSTMADVMVDAIKRFRPDLVVVDESHKIKNSEANASRLLARVQRFVPRRIILTGTVMPNGPLDVFGQWQFLAPYAFGLPGPDGEILRATQAMFTNRFAVYGGWMGKEVVGYRNLDEMQKILARNATVARKKDALDLPPTTDVDLPVHLRPAEAKAYAEMKSALATELASGVEVTAVSRLTMTMRLRQLTSGHVPDDDGAVRVVGTSKVDTIKSLVHDTLAGEKRIVIFALFTQEIEMLRHALKHEGTVVQTITGATPGPARVHMRKHFGSDSPERIVMIAQIKTMSLAVNELVTANHAIFASLSLQRDDYVQARDRLDRIGQTRPVTFWHAIVPGTVDEVILKSHREKTDLEAAMLRHIQGEKGVLESRPAQPQT